MRFFVATLIALGLILATPAHAKPFFSADTPTWLDAFTSWIEDLVGVDKGGEEEPPPPPDPDDPPPPEDSARGEISGNG